MIESVEKESIQDDISTKQRILTCAVNLFAKKGFTETTIRELAVAAGLKGGSIYNHFPSKNAILEYILDDYSAHNSGTFNKETAIAKLRKNSTTDGVMDCLNLSFPEGRRDYYLKVLCVLLQEQYRNPVIQDFVCNRIILQNERDIREILQILKDLNVIRQDTDSDPWVKAYSGLLYAFSGRRMLGIGDNSPDFSGMGMNDILKYFIDLMLTTCACEALGSSGN